MSLPMVTVTAANAEQRTEAALLAVVEALVERLGGVSELLHAGRPRGHRVGAFAHARDRVGSGLRGVRAGAARFAAFGPRACTLGALLGEIAQRGLDRRPVLLLLGGELQ